MKDLDKGNILNKSQSNPLYREGVKYVQRVQVVCSECCCYVYLNV